MYNVQLDTTPESDPAHDSIIFFFQGHVLVYLPTHVSFVFFSDLYRVRGLQNNKVDSGEVLIH